MLRLKPSLYLRHPELSAAVIAPFNCDAASEFRIHVFRAEKNPITSLSVRPLLQKHALPRLARVLLRPLLNVSNDFLELFIGCAGAKATSSSFKWAALAKLA
jgi:hypothetical protein